MIKRKYILYLFISLFIFNSCLINVYAGKGYNLNDIKSSVSGDTSNSPSQPGGGAENPTPKYTSEWKVGNVTYNCSGYYKVIRNRTIGIDAIDINSSKSVLGNDGFGNYSVNAGMSLGLMAYEERSAALTDFKVEVTKITPGTTKSVKTGYNCSYFAIKSYYSSYCNSICSSNKCTNVKTCPSYNSSWCSLNSTPNFDSRNIDPVTETIDSGSEYEKCKTETFAKAKNAVIGSVSNYAPYNISFNDSNDVIKMSFSDDDNPIIYEQGSKKTNCSSEKSCSTSLRVKYSVKNVCMDTRNGNVYYRSKCADNEIRIDDTIYEGNKYFHYFVPLTVTSNSNLVRFSISGGEFVDKDMCIGTIKDNKSYMEFLIPADGQTFDGTNADLRRASNGCYISININIPVTQKFFKEAKTDDGKLVLSDHNFYYRKINISNPFPKGVESYSLWKDWYDENYQGGSYKNNAQGKPNIKSSFNSITYVSTPSQVNNSYSISSDYLDWSKMGLNGLNGYINNGLVATRNITTDKIYSLGMGPGVCIDEGVVVNECAKDSATCKCIK